MKFLKYLLLVLVIAIIGIAIFIATQPNEYDVSRTRVINAPASYVFNNVNEFKNWQKWGPWMEEDPTIEATYPEQTSGVGGHYSWTSKQGPGNIKTVSLEPNASINQKIQFSDYEPSDVYWKFKEVEGGTEVTWGMKSDNVPFDFKMGSAFSGGFDGMLGPMHEKGLENLDKVITEEMKKNPPKKFRLGAISEKQLGVQKFIGYFQSTSTDDHETISKLFQEFIPKAGKYAMEQKLSYTDMTPAAVFQKWDEENNKAEFYIGLLLKKDLAPAKGMTAINLPSGKALALSKFGYYGTGDQEAHMAIDTYIKSHKLEMNGPVWELYVNNPEKVKKEDVQTDIYYPVK